MVILIAGATHAGKTALAKKLLARSGIPYFSIDWLKMGLIRSGRTALTPEDDEALVGYLWPVVREMVRTVVENGQDLILEGCYIPLDWAGAFDEATRAQIRYVCLVLDEAYIRDNFALIAAQANVAERRLDDSGCTPAALLRDHRETLQQCRRHGLPFRCVSGDWQAETDALAADLLRPAPGEFRV